jgi:hypothetical protein
MKLAMAALDTGADLADLEARGMEPQGLKARAKVHEALRQRLARPKPSSSRRVPKRPPELAVQAGEVYSYPTMNGSGLNAWFASWEQAKFQPDGWGALIILETGRVFDWFAWGSYSAVVVNPHTEPSLDDVLAAKTLFGDGVAYFAPKRSHMKKMGMKLLGKVAVHPPAVEILKKLSGYTPKHAVMCDWSICSGAFSREDQSLGKTAVRDLLA